MAASEGAGPTHRHGPPTAAVCGREHCSPALLWGRLSGRLTRAPCTPRPLCGPRSPSQRPPRRTDSPQQRKERGPGLEALEILENSAGENWHFNWVLC